MSHACALAQFLLKPIIQALVNFKFTPFNSMVDQEVFVLFWVFQITNNFLLYSVSATLLADFYVYLAEVTLVLTATALILVQLPVHVSSTARVTRQSFSHACAALLF